MLTRDEIEASLRKKKAEIARNAEDIEVAGLVAKRLNNELTELKIMAMYDRKLLCLCHWRYADYCLYADSYDCRDFLVLMGSGTFQLDSTCTLLIANKLIQLSFVDIDELTKFVATHHLDVDYSGVIHQFLEESSKCEKIKALVEKLNLKV